MVQPSGAARAARSCAHVDLFPWRWIAATVVCLIAVLVTTVPARAAAAGCADVAIIGAAGSGESGLGGVAPFADAMQTAAPDLRIARLAVDYKPVGVWPGSPRFAPHEYNPSVHRGITKLTALIGARTRACPAELEVIAGYSQGADVVAYTLGSLDPHGPIVAVELFGDPHFRPHAPSDRGAVDGWGVLNPHVLRTRPPAVWASTTESWCIRGDVICQGLHRHTGAAAHKRYRSVAAQATRFALARVRNRVAARMPVVPIPPTAVSTPATTTALPASDWSARGDASLQLGADGSSFTISTDSTFWAGAIQPVPYCDYTLTATAREKDGSDGDGYGLAVRGSWTGDHPVSGPAFQYDLGVGGYRITEYPDSEGGSTLKAADDRNWHTLSVGVHGAQYIDTIDGVVVSQGTTTSTCGSDALIRLWRGTVEVRDVHVGP